MLDLISFNSLLAQIFSHLIKHNSGLEFMNQEANCVAFCAEMGWRCERLLCKNSKGPVQFSGFCKLFMAHDHEKWIEKYENLKINTLYQEER